MNSKQRWERDNKARRREVNKAWRERQRQVMKEAKAKPCADCGIQYPPYVMQFDHVSGEKVMDIGDRYYAVSLSRLLAEIDKCEVVCANCHAARTYWRRVS